MVRIKQNTLLIVFCFCLFVNSLLKSPMNPRNQNYSQTDTNPFVSSAIQDHTLQILGNSEFSNTSNWSLDLTQNTGSLCHFLIENGELHVSEGESSMGQGLIEKYLDGYVSQAVYWKTIANASLYTIQNVTLKIGIKFQRDQHDPPVSFNNANSFAICYAFIDGYQVKGIQRFGTTEAFMPGYLAAYDLPPAPPFDEVYHDDTTSKIYHSYPTEISLLDYYQNYAGDLTLFTLYFHFEIMAGINAPVDYEWIHIYVDYVRLEFEVQDLDNDGDNLTNAEEASLGTNLNNNDTDGDGLSDYDEVMGTFGYTSNPCEDDTDHDGLNDKEEVTGGIDGFITDPKDNDTDHDLLIDYWELGNNTSPLNPDMDDDGMLDGWEVQFTLDPLNNADKWTDLDEDEVPNIFEFGNGTNPSMNDTDSDNMPELWEIINGFDPTYGGDNLTDVDSDALTNIDEYYLGTNPNVNDTDQDGMSDGWELQYALNPLSGEDNLTDSDNDSLINLVEYDIGTNPRSNDTDYDGMDDWWEVQNSFNPLSGADNLTDADNDGLLNIYEYQNGTNPHSNDTDEDQLPDLEEVTVYHSDPTKIDSDDDTFTDYQEVNYGTNPVDKWWYPMPNLMVTGAIVAEVTAGDSYYINWTVTNNGIFPAYGIYIRVWCQELGIIILQSEMGFSLDVGKSKFFSYEDSHIIRPGSYTLVIMVDPFNAINETYSQPDGSLRLGSKLDNNSTIILSLKSSTTSSDTPPPIPPVVILGIIVVGIIAVVFIVGISMFLKKRRIHEYRITEIRSWRKKGYKF